MKSSLTSAVIAIVALIVGLSALDQFLAKVESSELHSTAERSYIAGYTPDSGGKGRGSDRPVQKRICDRTRQSRI